MQHIPRISAVSLQDKYYVSARRFMTLDILLRNKHVRVFFYSTFPSGHGPTGSQNIAMGGHHKCNTPVTNQLAILPGTRLDIVEWKRTPTKLTPFLRCGVRTRLGNYIDEIAEHVSASVGANFKHIRIKLRAASSPV